jgi:tRNA pseudouridine55 synthase
MNGLLVVDKPGGMTSRDVVNRIQKWFPKKTKIGHTGTLDPLATGVLVVCIGAATRLADYVQAMGKSYRTRILLGQCSDTDDADGTLTPVANIANIAPVSEVAIRAALHPFIGAISQMPPAYSALKVAGQRAHELARSGENVPLAARTVQVRRIDLTGYSWPFVDLEIDCGKGTYIRSIARDLGQSLGVGGLVQTLRRTQVGPFTAEQGLSLDADPSTVQSSLRPIAEAVVNLPRIEFTDDEVRRFRFGQPVPTESNSSGTVAVFQNEELIGIGMVHAACVQPKVVC